MAEARMPTLCNCGSAQSGADHASWCAQRGYNAFRRPNTDSTFKATTCYYCGLMYNHAPGCPGNVDLTATGGAGKRLVSYQAAIIPDYIKGSYSCKLTNTKGETMANDKVIEVVLLKKATKEDDAKIIFGPKAFVASDPQSAVLVATAEAIASSVVVDATTDARSRFFA